MNEQVKKYLKKLKNVVDIWSGICYYNTRPVRTGHGLLKKFKNKIKKLLTNSTTSDILNELLLRTTTQRTLKIKD